MAELDLSCHKYPPDHFNPYSLANKSLDCQTQSHDILFNLHKKVINVANGDKVEVIPMGRLIYLV